MGRGKGGWLTVGVADIVDLLQRQAGGSGGAAAQLDDVGDGFEGHEAIGGGGGGFVFGDAQLAALGILELDFEDAVGLDIVRGLLVKGGWIGRDSREG